MFITQENAEKYEGKYLDVKNGFPNYYPLKVVKRRTVYHVIDGRGTMMIIPREKDGGIFFENVLEL